MSLTFFMAGGGTGGHVIPGIAVARELKARGHRVVFVGTREGMEARLVPIAGFEIEWIEIGGLKRVGLAQTAKTLAQLPLSVMRCSWLLGRNKAAGVFSMGGYVAAPVMIAAWLREVPVVLMEPNAMPGMTNRRMSRFAKKALVGFKEALPYFPEGRAEIAGLPVRSAFFDLPAKPRGEVVKILITGGSRGSRTLNNAARELWPLIEGTPVELIHQAGRDDAEKLAAEFKGRGRVVAFVDDMPAAFGEADLIVCRSGAGAVSELAAAGKPALLVPFPYATDDHQLRNAEAMAKAGAARVILDKECTGERLWVEIREVLDTPGLLEQMGEAARSMAHPGAAKRAADLLEEYA